MIKKTAIIVAGGSGTRMNTSIPKQFLLLAGKPMLMHSLGAFEHAFPGITLILALPKDQFTHWRELCDQYAFRIPHQLVAGGETRFHSVQNALSAVEPDGLVAIHDGARPLVSASLIRAAFDAAAKQGNCIPVIPLNESVRILSDNRDGVAGPESVAVNRRDYRIVQTPQVFHADLIREAYCQEFRGNFTDDAVVAESVGETIYLMPGDPVNIKITYPHDLAAAEVLMGNQGTRNNEE